MKLHQLSMLIIIPLFTASCSVFEENTNNSEMIISDAGTIDLLAEQALEQKNNENIFKNYRREMIIFFSYDNDDVLESADKMLDAHADYLNNNKDIVVMIEGHADEIGTDDYNKTLSLSRANKVKRELTSRGVQDAQIIVKPQSEDKILDHTSTEKGRSFNRRVEFIY
jgi:peptidoglycan-associated lipoprotein